MVSQCPCRVLHGHDVELDASLEGCILVGECFYLWEAVALDGVWSSNPLLLLYIPFNLPL